MPIYMKVEGVKGDVVVVGASRPGRYDRWIELASAQVYTGPGLGNVAVSSEGGLGDVSIARKIDDATPALHRLTGRSMPGMKVSIAFVKDGTSNTYLRYELENVVISSYSISGSAGDAMETLSLNFTKASSKN